MSKLNFVECISLFRLKLLINKLLQRYDIDITKNESESIGSEGRNGDIEWLKQKVESISIRFTVQPKLGILVLTFKI